MELKGEDFSLLFRCKLNHFGVKRVYMVSWSLTYQQNVFRKITVGLTDFSAVYLQDGGEKRRA